MKKKIIFIGMVLLALALTSGVFAYGYAGQDTAQMTGTLADDNFTTYQPSAVQPKWENVLPNAIQNMENLLPVAAGDQTEFNTQYPDTGANYDKVSDISAKDSDTYISTAGSNPWQTDLFTLSPFNGMSGLAKISNVTISLRVSSGGDDKVDLMAVLKTNGQVYASSSLPIKGADFVDVQWVCPINPNSGKAWTYNDINTLQVGLTAKGHDKNPLVCTSFYVTVGYSYTYIEGSVPTGDLFDIIPNQAYTGDLMVKIYLTNTADLLKAYKYLNIKVYVTNSIESTETPNYKVLSMENGVAIFLLPGGAAQKYYVQVSGGGYRITSDDTSEWTTGWTVTPEFYCEVTQR
jgi:hypothetical protein